MKKKLYTGYNEYEDIARSMEFEVVSEVPEVGDAWGSTCEVTGVTEVSLDNNENDKSYPDRYKAYRVEHINRGDEDTAEPFVDYVAIKEEGQYQANGYIDSEGSVFVSGLVDTLWEMFGDKTASGEKIVEDIEHAISELLGNDIEVWSEEVHTNPYSSENLYKFYTDSMREEDDAIVVETEDDEETEGNETVVDIRVVAWAAYR